MAVELDIPATVQGRDRDGRFWAFLDEAAHPDAIVTGHLVVAGDAADPVVARVLDIVERRAARRWPWNWSVTLSSDGMRSPRPGRRLS